MTPDPRRYHPLDPDNGWGLDAPVSYPDRPPCARQVPVTNPTDNERTPVTQEGEGEWREENASVEVWRWGASVRVAIRSEDSVGKSIELTIPDARDLAERLLAAINAGKRKVKDDPHA